MLLENLKEFVNDHLKSHGCFGRASLHQDTPHDLTVIIEITTKPTSDIGLIKENLINQLQTTFNLERVSVAFTNAETVPLEKPEATSLSQVKRIIAVASGKGGVGKSTVAKNLALALGHLNLKIGLLDGDIYGPSVPILMGEMGQPEVRNKKFIPFTHHGISWMSMGSLLGKNAPAVWRGPMAQKAFLQLFNDVHWGKLDYLIVDMPPGTGDIQLALAQKIPVDGALIVSTPQDIALLDVKRSIEMFKKVNVPIIGLVENMSYFRCPHCENTTPIFGHDLSQEAANLGLTLLAQIPLELAIREYADQGMGLPTQSENYVFAPFFDLAKRIHAAF